MMGIVLMGDDQTKLKYITDHQDFFKNTRQVDLRDLALDFLRGA